MTGVFIENTARDFGEVTRHAFTCAKENIKVILTTPYGYLSFSETQ